MGGQAQPPGQEADWAGPSPIALSFPVRTVRGLADYLQLCPGQETRHHLGQTDWQGECSGSLPPCQITPVSQFMRCLYF